MLIKEENIGGVEMLTKEEMELFEQEVRSRIEAQQEKIGLSDESVGRIAFSFLPYPRMKLQRIKRGQGRAGQRVPQQLRWADMVNLCEAVGLSWTDVGREALKAVKAAAK